MAGEAVGTDMSHTSWDKVIDCLALQAVGFSTIARMKGRRDIEVVGTQMLHWDAKQRRGGRRMVGGESMGLKKITVSRLFRAE
jgi:hypothetical protein